MSKVLAEVVDYNGLVLALRQRAVDLNVAISSLDLSEEAGLPERYIPKLLAPRKRPEATKRTIGPISMGPLLAVLGVKLHVVEDPALTAKIARMPKRSAMGASISAGSGTACREARKLKQAAANG